ncbi:AAA family ATPase [Nocardiopsis sp. CT-R113]|uniref:AAA family ATPase n=1 Tax=Nocardiopsis codii TaxID=3065942 RepID=A0ABU7KG42_9ACTN|nr:AAA family ATPase [Nocardiopsis sp. CT-R113]MEE2040889.1 AAA family ATPase [Nocardiopsis sp. CT-R113]
MLGIRIVSLEIHGPEGARTIDLDHSFVAVHGPTNSGKTSLADAISYCLGQKVEWRLAFSKYVTLCVLQIRIGRKEYILRRPLGKSGGEIEVLNIGHEIIARMPVKVAKDNPGPTFSDWILSELELKDLVDSDEIRALNSRSTRLTFNEVWPYLYRMQSEIDRQVILHAGGRDGARRTLFELLFGLSDPKVRILETQLKETRRAAKEQERRLVHIQGFFSEAGTSPERAAAEQEDAQKQLERLTTALKKYRTEITEWEKTRSALQERRKNAQRLWRQASAARGQEAPSPQSGQVHHNYSPQQRWNSACCPACGQDLFPGRASAGECVLCLQRTPKTSSPSAPVHSAPHTVVPGQADEELKRASAELGRALDALEQHEADDPAPARLALIELTSQRSACQERISQLAEGIAESAKLQELRAGINSAKEQTEHLKREILTVEDQVQQRGQILMEIEKRLHEEIEKISPPWFEGSVKMDRQRYLPLVDGQTFSQLGGGVKAAVNVAYSLALLRHSTAPGDVYPPRLPFFLIVDAIRKNIGSNESDKDFSSRLYRRAFTATDVFSSHEVGQVIVLDNDEPPKGYVPGKQFKDVRLSHEEPLIPGVSHKDTGEDPLS